VSELREILARAMRAQGKVDPERVFTEADQISLDDDCPFCAPDERCALHQPPPPQNTLPLDGDDQRGYGWEP
jgi:hypothetical protein